MKALFLADLYQMKMHFKYYGFFVLLSAVIAVGGGIGGVGGMGMFFPIYAVLMCSVLGTSLMQLDEQSRWNIYVQALPCSRRDQVSSKYAVTLACTGAVWVLFLLIYTALALAGYMDWSLVLALGELLLLIGLLAPSISLPPMFRWGSAKGRVIYVVLVVVLASGMGATFSAPDMAGGAVELPGPVAAALTVLVPVALFAGSWALSVRWYEKREL